MKTVQNNPIFPPHSLTYAALTLVAAVAALLAWSSVDAQTTLPMLSPATPPSMEMRTTMSIEAAARLHVTGLAMQRRHDDHGAFVAFSEAAENGYPPSQRRLAEIYDRGNKSVKRNYEEAIRWYEKAREGGEDIPSPPSRMPGLDAGPK